MASQEAKEKKYWDSITSQFPDSEILKSALSNIFILSDAAKISLIYRNTNVYSSTSPSEIVKCYADEVGEKTLLIKYTPQHVLPRKPGNSRGHRGGLAYEAEVYKHLLEKTNVPTVKCYGATPFSADGRVCLVFDFVEDSLRVNKVVGGVLGATRWAAQFHDDMNLLLGEFQYNFLKRYDINYYSTWVNQAYRLTADVQRKQAWLGAVFERFSEVIESILGREQTIIHGEFTSSNIITKNTVVYTIDWESAAIGLREIDLASLWDGWGDTVTQECIQEYRSFQKIQDSDLEFHERLNLARMYWHLRWLGDEGAAGEAARRHDWHFVKLRAAAKELNLI